ncbi:hypothetical protein BpHYR1_042974 [Brachionus plicatilis]|uniref:Uncharacterized protein n=1 Tax=Brachionus plicatilis TaxID=10195 RepID=A0A3M7P556_BRAPC|nr:hypothetical protein BpHYR1_042974 [Brachionus plicatilis]
MKFILIKKTFVHYDIKKQIFTFKFIGIINSLKFFLYFSCQFFVVIGSGLVEIKPKTHLN